MYPRESAAAAVLGPALKHAYYCIAAVALYLMI
jgi:hypothetical protein